MQRSQLQSIQDIPFDLLGQDNTCFYSDNGREVGKRLLIKSVALNSDRERIYK